MDGLRQTNDGTSSMMMIEDFGPAVASVWNDLRSTTRKMVERAWQSAVTPHSPPAMSMPYDPRADHELIRLLEALDAQATEAEESSNGEALTRAHRLAEACANVLIQQTQSAEVFARLVERAHERKDYARIDALAEKLGERLAPSEICELARSHNVVVRALAQEALTHMPTAMLMALLRDPVDASVARLALERQAHEYNSAEAKRVLRDFDDYGWD